MIVVYKYCNILSSNSHHQDLKIQDLFVKLVLIALISQHMASKLVLVFVLSIILACTATSAGRNLKSITPEIGGGIGEGSDGSDVGGRRISLSFGLGISSNGADSSSSSTSSTGSGASFGFNAGFGNPWKDETISN